MFASFFLTGELVSSRRASAATHFADLESESLIFPQVLIAAAFKALFLLPICLSAQFTAFLTKLRSSSCAFFETRVIPSRDMRSNL